MERLEKERKRLEQERKKRYQEQQERAARDEQEWKPAVREEPRSTARLADDKERSSRHSAGRGHLPKSRPAGAESRGRDPNRGHKDEASKKRGHGNLDQSIED